MPNPALLAGPTGVRLHQLAGLDWVAFARSEAPSWHDQVTATLRSHGVVRLGPGGEGGEHPLIAEVKLASVAAGHAFALAPPGLLRSPLTAVVRMVGELCPGLSHGLLDLRQVVAILVGGYQRESKVARFIGDFGVRGAMHEKRGQVVHAVPRAVRW